MLIYCGATSAFYNSYIEGKVENEEKRQIDAVIEMLGNGLNMRVTKFTSEESAQEREEIKQNFADGHLLQALVAIRCLDEGVNIPRIKQHYISKAVQILRSIYSVEVEYWEKHPTKTSHEYMTLLHYLEI